MAAVAALHGWSVKDVLDVEDPTEYQLVVEVLQEAERIRSKRLDAFLKNLEAVVQNGVAKAMG